MGVATQLKMMALETALKEYEKALKLHSIEADSLDADKKKLDRLELKSGNEGEKKEKAEEWMQKAESFIKSTTNLRDLAKTMKEKYEDLKKSADKKNLKDEKYKDLSDLLDKVENLWKSLTGTKL